MDTRLTSSIAVVASSTQSDSRWNSELQAARVDQWHALMAYRKVPWRQRRQHRVRSRWRLRGRKGTKWLIVTVLLLGLVGLGIVIGFGRGRDQNREYSVKAYAQSDSHARLELVESFSGRQIEFNTHECPGVVLLKVGVTYPARIKVHNNTYVLAAIYSVAIPSVRNPNPGPDLTDLCRWY